MPIVEQSIDIQAPIDVVFDALTDPRRTQEWNPNIVEVSGVTYPLREGSSWRQVALVLGKPANLSCRIVRFLPPHEGVLEISGDQRARAWTRCESLGSSTRVTQGIDFAPPGGRLGKLAGGLARPAVQYELHQTMTRQRAILEAEFGGVRQPRSSG